MIISMIVAFSANGVIGKDNSLPWHIGADMKHLKQITTGHTVLMGKNTYDSIGRPLPNRRNVVLSRTLKPEDAPGVEIIRSVEEIASLGLGADEELIIMGGTRVYGQFLPKAEKLYITHVHAVVDGDAHIPAIDWNEWTCSEHEQGKADEKNDFDYTFATYLRKK
ncbi:MAG: dihydrofolate reductase [Bacteroidales bacterium]|nr:dihydrofolate reductase [Candidatus Physcocola equi]